MEQIKRIIDPPYAELASLVTPLTKGERRVIELFDENLPLDWEIYVQPHLNGLRPDLVLLNPKVGIAVFEIKDWNLSLMEVQNQPDEKSGRTTKVLTGRGADGIEYRHRENPVDKILRYKRELQDLYCPRIEHRAGAAVITAGLIFTQAATDDINRVIMPLVSQHPEMKEYEKYYPVSGSLELDESAIERIFPEMSRLSSVHMNSDIADDLRAWLRAPDHSSEQGKSILLDEQQRLYATTRTETGYRRIKGPAGSGKSLVLAARASMLAAQGKRVLVVTFNITLINYLRALTFRFDGGRRYQKNIVFLNYHYWCARVCSENGRRSEYIELFKTESYSHVDDILGYRLPALVHETLSQIESTALKDHAYDAILVDEGQDFRPQWWSTLRMILAYGGEMVLFADKTQNVYSTAASWTEDAMQKAGFRGNWAILERSYRLPPFVVPFVREFAQSFMKESEVDLPVPDDTEQLEFEALFPVKMKWVQIASKNTCVHDCIVEILEMMKVLNSSTSVSDVVFLSNDHVGMNVADQLYDKFKIKIQSTHSADKAKSRKLKVAFHLGSPLVKATTIQSFKGWEARQLVVCVESASRPEDRALLYTALTRLKRHESGSSITVVSACPELNAYGRSWPNFIVR